jgi:hypothetical protein
MVCGSLGSAIMINRLISCGTCWFGFLIALRAVGCSADAPGGTAPAGEGAGVNAPGSSGAASGASGGGGGSQTETPSPPTTAATTTDTPDTTRPTTPPVVPEVPGIQFDVTFNGASRALDLNGPKPAAGHSSGPKGLIDITAWFVAPNTHKDGYFDEEKISIRVKPNVIGKYSCAPWGDAANALYYMHIRFIDTITETTPKEIAYKPMELISSRSNSCEINITRFDAIGGWVTGTAHGTISRNDQTVNPTLSQTISFTINFNVPRVRAPNET